MNDTKKLLFSDSGKGHPLIMRQWVAVVLALIGNGLTFYNRWSNWQTRTQFYWLWSELPPSSPFFADVLLLSVLGIALAISMGKVISKNEIYIYDNGIEGYGFKFWGFWPRVHYFELGYDDIESFRKRRQGLSIHSAYGQYRFIVHNPEMCIEKITMQYKNGDIPE